MSKADLAKMGVPSQLFWTFGTWVKKITLLELYKIVKLFGISPHELIKELETEIGYGYS